MIFCLQINIKDFFKFFTMILGVCGQTCPNYPQNNKFVISLQYLKKEESDEVMIRYYTVILLHDTVINTIIFYGDGQAFPKSPK